MFASGVLLWREGPNKVAAEISLRHEVFSTLTPRWFRVRLPSALDALAHAIRRSLPSQQTHENFNRSALNTRHDQRYQLTIE